MDDQQALLDRLVGHLGVLCGLAVGHFGPVAGGFVGFRGHGGTMVGRTDPFKTTGIPLTGLRRPPYQTGDGALRGSKGNAVPAFRPNPWLPPQL